MKVEQQKKLLSIVVELAKELGRIPKNIDILIGGILTHDVFGGFDVHKARTISSMMGEEQAKVLYDEWDRKGKNFYPWIPLNHPFSQILADLCEAIQPWHCLVSIEWKKVEKWAEPDYPGIRKVVEDFLRLQGVRV